jgi:1-phosphofructokinase
MIVTVTPSPSLDRTYEIDALVRGEVNRARRASVQAGGKGVNVTRALDRQRVASRAVLPVGGSPGRRLVELLEADGLDIVAVPVDADVRTNISLVEPGGGVTKINDPGRELHTGELEALLAAVAGALDDARWLATCGSLPPGVDDDLHGRLVDIAHERGLPAAVDASGPALVAALAHGPDVIKPNEHELAAAVGRPLATLGEVVAAADELRGAGARRVVASLGADGAVLVDDAGAVHASGPAVRVRSAVGAGDTLLAGFLSAGGDGPEALRRAVAWGAAAAALPGTSVPDPGDVDVDAIELHDLDPDRVLGAARS